jgi:hypothetical protein
MGQFQNDHDAIRAAMQRYAALLTRGHDAVAAEMLRERVLFSHLLHRHRADEDGATGRMLPGALLAAALAADMQALLAEYSAHVRTWPPSRIPGEWDDYGEAVLRLQQRMRMRLAWEERELFPHLSAA